MGTIIFSGSWFSFISISLLWVTSIVLLVILFKRGEVSPFMLKYGKWPYGLFYLVVLIILLVSNFQYTSRDVSAEVRGFDAPVETQVIEGKKVERMTSSDVTEKFYSTIDHEKQENRSNEKN